MVGGGCVGCVCGCVGRGGELQQEQFAGYQGDSLHYYVLDGGILQAKTFEVRWWRTHQDWAGAGIFDTKKNWKSSSCYPM